MFVFIDIRFVKQDIQKWLKTKIYAIFMENLKMKRKKGQKKFDLPKQRFEPQIFSNFPDHLNFHVK